MPKARSRFWARRTSGSDRSTGRQAQPQSSRRVPYLNRDATPWSAGRAGRTSFVSVVRFEGVLEPGTGILAMKQPPSQSVNLASPSPTTLLIRRFIGTLSARSSQ